MKTIIVERHEFPEFIRERIYFGFVDMREALGRFYVDSIPVAMERQRIEIPIHPTAKDHE